MKTAVIVALLIVIAAGVIWTMTADAQSSKKVKWNVIDVGAIPSNFGDLFGFSGSTNNYGMAFKDDDGNIRIVEFRGGKINPRAFRVKRTYDD